jgi:glucose/arabinose dehydrogenase
MRSHRSRLIAGALLTVFVTACADGGDPAAVRPQPSASSALETKALHTGFSSPTGLAFGPDGAMYVSNWSAGTVERIGEDGARSTYLDGLDSPAGLAMADDGVLYVADYSADVIYRATGAGEFEEFADGFHTPTGIGFDRQGGLLVANRASDEIVRVGPDGARSTLAGGLRTPVGVAAHPDGTVYVANYDGGIARIRPGGRPATLSDDVEGPGVGIVVTEDGELYVADRAGGEVTRVRPDGSTRPVLRGLDSPVALGVDAEGELHTATWGDAAVYRVPG